VPFSAVPISVVIPTLNEVDRLPGCLASVAWADEIIVADAGSTDGTCELARDFGALVIDRCGPTIGAQKNAAIVAARHPWILSVDADERVTPELRRSIEAAIAAPRAGAYWVRLRNLYLGAPLDRGSWGRDRHVRLYPSTARWSDHQVHEQLVVDGPLGDLTGRLEHQSYRDLAHQLEKGLRYARWGAEDLAARGKRPRLSQMVLNPFWRFVKMYLMQGLWREGRRGFVFSIVHAWCAFAKYALLWADAGARTVVVSPAARPEPAPMHDQPVRRPSIAPSSLVSVRQRA
jgi:glycosyltransferase involved in cell wall biosynthesis